MSLVRGSGQRESPGADPCSVVLRSVPIGQDGYVPAPLRLLGRHQVVLSLPELGLDELLPAGEVLAQEGFLTWVLTADALDILPALRSAFGRRVVIGVGGVQRPDQVVAAAEQGAAFVSSDFLLPELLSAGPELPVMLGGLTPSELRSGLEAGASAMQVVPAGAYRGEVQVLPELLGFPMLIAHGTFTPERARDWLDAGATAVWPRRLIGVELLTGATLGGLRSLLRDWRLAD